MGLTSIDFSQIENIENTPTGININKGIRFNNQLQISNIPPSQENTTNIWFNKTTEELKIRINNTTYDLQPSATLNSIVISSNTTLNLSGKRGIINNLTITGTNTILTIRTGLTDWSILEVQGNLSIASGCTLNLIRTPLIVRGNITGSGIIKSPDGVNGGLGGVGGPGGTRGLSGLDANGGTFAAPSPGQPGFSSPSTWSNMNGSLGSLMPVEYGISSGKGGDGGRGTGGGGGGGDSRGLGYAWPGGSSGAGSNPSYPGAPGVYYDLRDGYYYAYQYSGGGGGAGGAGGGGDGTPGGPGAFGATGTNGTSAGSLTSPYVGIGTPSLSGTAPSQGTTGGATFGGAGGAGGAYIHPNTYFGSPGSPGGTGGGGGPGGSTGGAHLTIFCIGTIDNTITFMSGKGGINGGVSTGPKATSGSIWLFNQYGTSSSPGNYDISGVGPAPTGPAGTVNRILTSDTTSVNNFFRDILYNSNGLTPAKDIITITI